MNIQFANQQIKLLPSGGCLVIDEQALVVSDLHLGKGVMLQDSGVPLIDQIDTSTMDKLKADLKKWNPKVCIICGDLIHGMSKHMHLHIKWFCDELSSFETSFYLTIGNHDGKKLSQLVDTIECVEHYSLGTITCCHYPYQFSPSISGHVHPGVTIKKGRFTTSYKAFAINSDQIICPSYGTHTGLWPKLDKNMTLYLLDNNKVKKHK